LLLILTVFVEGYSNNRAEEMRAELSVAATD